MARILDYVSVSFIIGFLTFVWAGLVLKNIALAIIVAVAFVAVFIIVSTKLKRRESKPYEQDRLSVELAIKGPTFLIEILKSILQNKVFESGFNYICLEKALIYVCFKFSNVTIADMPNIYAIATKYDNSRVFLFARGVERKASRLLESYGIYVTVVKIKAIYKLLKRHGKLPYLPKPKYRFSIRDLPSLFLSKSKVKGLIFSGVILIASAFFTPLKIYYLVFGSISLVLALLSFTPLGKEAPAYDKLLDLFNTSNSTENQNPIGDSVKSDKCAEKDANGSAIFQDDCNKNKDSATKCVDSKDSTSISQTAKDKFDNDGKYKSDAVSKAAGGKNNPE